MKDTRAEEERKREVDMPRCNGACYRCNRSSTCIETLCFKTSTVPTIAIVIRDHADFRSRPGSDRRSSNARARFVRRCWISPLTSCCTFSHEIRMNLRRRADTNRESRFFFFFFIWAILLGYYSYRIWILGRCGLIRKYPLKNFFQIIRLYKISVYEIIIFLSSINL